MSDQCNESACAGCSENCSDRKAPQAIAKDKPLDSTHIKKVIAVMSGKGGVGKSMVTSLLACEMRKRGHSAAILDADITGPSIPKAFGIHDMAQAKGSSIIPMTSKGGIDIMSINLLLEKETDAVIWRGPVISGVVKQFWSQVLWGTKDYMFIDMPPGTGDVALTVFQSIPVDAVVLVTSPQELVAMIVDKAVGMTSRMDLPVAGIIENMSYFVCPDCDAKHSIFGDSKLEAKAAEHKLPILGRLPIDPAVARAADAGAIEAIAPDYLAEAADCLEKL